MKEQQIEFKRTDALQTIKEAKPKGKTSRRKQQRNLYYKIYNIGNQGSSRPETNQRIGLVAE